jgi:leucyl/phenylalanyl-tRNA---protein transferase
MPLLRKPFPDNDICKTNGMQYGPVFLNENLWFPPANDADEDGLLAVGGDLDPERLLLAYRKGIFPWYSGPVPLWWHPDPRLVLFPKNIRVSKSMQQIFKKNTFQFTRNTCFKEVIEACGNTFRKGQNGETWVTKSIISSYSTLHQWGYADSFEAWENGDLAGGLYGVRLGNIFFGESMFARKSNASKAAFIWSVQQMQQEGLAMIDCQVETGHLMSLGAELISRKDFMEILEHHIYK